jgi:syntaxin-binding protein 1
MANMSLNQARPTPGAPIQLGGSNAKPGKEEKDKKKKKHHFFGSSKS